MIRWDVLRAGDRGLAPSSDRTLAREQLTEAVLLPEAEEHRRTVIELIDAHTDVLLSSAPLEAGLLPRDTAAWLRTPA